MAFLSNVHTHTPYCDGTNTVEENILKALELGFLSVGISEHGPAVYAKSGILPENIPAYLNELSQMKEKYRDKIEVYTGFEVDKTKLISKEGLDYTIGSVHFVHSKNSGKYHIIDFTNEMYEDAIDDFGSVRNLVEHYFDENMDMALNYKPDIIGHMELLLKVNREEHIYFNPRDQWYRSMVQNAVDKISTSGCIVEVSTGMISRGFLKGPCPSEDTLYYILKQGVPVTISSDAHAIENLNYAFDDMELLLKDIGFKTVKILKGGSFKDMWL